MSGNLERLPLIICLDVLYQKVVFYHHFYDQIKKIDELSIKFWNYGHFYGLAPRFAVNTLYLVTRQPRGRSETCSSFKYERGYLYPVAFQFPPFKPKQ